MTGEKMTGEYIKDNAKCCYHCKHSRYSTRSLSSWCEKHGAEDYNDTDICKDFES